MKDSILHYSVVKKLAFYLIIDHRLNVQWPFMGFQLINSLSLRYETSAHLWLVLEYCVGGDLLSLLQQVSLTVLIHQW